MFSLWTWMLAYWQMRSQWWSGMERRLWRRNWMPLIWKHVYYGYKFSWSGLSPVVFYFVGHCLITSVCGEPYKYPPHKKLTSSYRIGICSFYSSNDNHASARKLQRHIDKALLKGQALSTLDSGTFKQRYIERFGIVIEPSTKEDVEVCYCEHVYLTCVFDIISLLVWVDCTSCSRQSWAIRWRSIFPHNRRFLRHTLLNKQVFFF